MSNSFRTLIEKMKKIVVNFKKKLSYKNSNNHLLLAFKF